MTDQVETVVIDALQRATGHLQDEESLARIAAGEDISFADWALESLDRFEAIMLIEEALDIELDDDEIVAQTSLRALVALVTEKLRAGP